MKCDSQTSLLACTFVSPYIGREPKIKVATTGVKKNYLNDQKITTFNRRNNHVEQEATIALSKRSSNNIKQKKQQRC
jgi:hypothetical protein